MRRRAAPIVLRFVFLRTAQLVALFYPEYADVTKRRLYRLKLDRIVTPAEVNDLPSLFYRLSLSGLPYTETHHQAPMRGSPI